MLSIKKVICSLSAALLVYHGRKGTHLKQKNEIAKKLLLTIIQKQSIIQTNPLLVFQESVVLYSTLIMTRDTLAKLRANKGGELDTLVEAYIKKWELALLQKIKN